MLLDTRLALADDDAVADDRGMVVDHRAAKPHDLLAEFLAGRENIG
jgi:hypothetical protein